MAPTPAPPPLIACTVKVYAVPGVSPIMSASVTLAGTFTLAPPGLAVTWYEVTGPPVVGAAVQLTVTRESPAHALRLPGCPGTRAKCVASAVHSSRAPPPWLRFHRPTPRRLLRLIRSY